MRNIESRRCARAQVEVFLRLRALSNESLKRSLKGRGYRTLPNGRKITSGGLQGIGEENRMM
jgi:hypothetical protein